ncbi:LPXTG cell wall anchor domain-containing protein [Clostridium sp. K12(2020)]|nr:LPXTG cell wall anchor domain-containing protein [Clostridium sp. K12(2020)]MBX9144496.1 LPXTG cell wall anchor domain-containing protein [Clostridium sp. K13]
MILLILIKGKDDNMVLIMKTITIKGGYDILIKKLMKKVLGIMVVVIYTTTLISIPVKAEESKIVNSSFSDWLDGWVVKGNIEAAAGKGNWGYDDSYSLGYWSESDYEVWTEQTITGIENGYYRVEAYAASSGNQKSHYIYANDFGGTGARTSIPITNDFTKVVLNFEVTNNQVTLGFYSNGKGGTWSNYDSVSLIKTDEEYKFLKGGDLTMVNYIEDVGGSFYDSEGEERDVFHILAENGFNFARLRTHNDTGRQHGSITNPDYYLPDGYQNTEDLLKSAKRAKEVGMEIEVTLNYSDWWPNGATQEIPSSWRNEIEGLDNEKTVDKLEQLVYEYTKDVMRALVNQGTTPEYISLGNEMQYGILYPYGKIANFEQLARFLNAGYRAVKEISTNTKVVLHLDEAGEDNRYTTFLDGCIKHNVNYDIIGASYYPFWTRKNVEDIIPWFNELSKKYGKKILIMETGYNWNPTKPDGWPGQLADNGNESHESSPQGQKEFLDELFNGIRNAEDNCIIGDLYWDPVMIDQEGVGWAIQRGEAEDGSEDKVGDNVVSNTTLFDFDGKALPALNSFRDSTEGTTKGIISGIVVGEGGNKIIGAEVIVDIDGEKYVKTTDKYGRFFINELEAEKNVNIIVNKEGYYSSGKVIEITKGEVTKIEIVLGSGSIQGNIRDDNDNPIEDVEIYAIVDGNKFSTNSKADGSYLLSDLPGGNSYTINAEKQGYESDSIKDVNVVIGECTSNIDFRLNINSGTIEGCITDDNGNAISEAEVSAISSAGTKYKSVTNSQGEYKIPYVISGKSYTITARKEGYFESSINNIIVEGGKATEGINLSLEKALGSIYGVVVDSNNNKLSDVNVTVTLKGEEKFTIISDENGIFEIKDVLDSTKYIIEGKKAGYGNAKLSNVEVEACSMTEVVLRMGTPLEINNWDFELGTLDGWYVDGDLDSVNAQDRTYFGDDAPSGKYALSIWNDKAFKTNIYQEVNDLNSGKYELSAWVYSGGDYNSDTMYIDNNGKIDGINIGYTNGWQKISLPVWIDSDSVKIGFDFDANAGCWTVIDSIELNYITSINYDELENLIAEVRGLQEKDYTPKSWSNLNESLKIAKKVLIDNEVTEEKIENTMKILKNAINELVKKGDKRELLLLIEEYKSIDESKYTEESIDNYKKALEMAFEVYNNEDATENEIENIVRLLKESYNGLEEIVKEEDVDKPGEDEGDGEIITPGDEVSKEDNNIIVTPDYNSKLDNSNNSDIEYLPKTGNMVSSQFIVLIGTISLVLGFMFYKKEKKLS